MRRLLASALAVFVLTGLAVASAPSASAGVCVEVRGRVRDAATGLPLDETTSVGIVRTDAFYNDGIGTDLPSSRWTTCLQPGTYTFAFAADSYRPEWYHDQTAATATEVTVPATGPVIVNESLVPRGKVLSGRVTNLGGVPKFASVGIWRRNAVGTWVGIDGIGNDMPSGIWSFRVPRLGRYRISVFVDSHWARWYDDDTRLRHARVVVVDEDTEFINGLDVQVPFCHPAPDFCVPPGFNT